MGVDEKGESPESTIGSKEESAGVKQMNCKIWTITKEK